MAKTNIYLFANWKMYLGMAESEKLSKDLVKFSKKLPKKIKMAVFPSALSSTAVVKNLKKTPIAVGAQNIYFEDKGGFTGEVSAAMYKDIGSKYALVGHSERRHLFHETNHEIRMKMEGALSIGLMPVLCVGETAQESAYEPVWAISKGLGVQEQGKHCDATEANRVHGFIKKTVLALTKDLEPIILFGGSVRPNTAAEYLKQSNIDGILVGAASTHLDSWKDIVHNAC
ncbi:MAG: triose-phosphate isomerase [Candidatus Magasanikbacteria bacterium]|nr:triose-phosphate isomerase [Candidatus Magasanikbacteria bacterium]